jgi:hypothetical protein
MLTIHEAMILSQTPIKPLNDGKNFYLSNEALKSNITGFKMLNKNRSATAILLHDTATEEVQRELF